MKTLCLFTLVLLCSCSAIERRTYLHTDDPSRAWKNYAYNQRSPLEREAMRELKLSNQASLTAYEAQQVALRVKVKELEKNLRSPTEIEQYYKHKPFFISDLQRIEFLNLYDVYQKQAWLEANVEAPISRDPAHVDTAIKNGDLVVNMTKEAVRKSWGNPETVEVSGSPLYGNERWTYSSFGDNNSNDYEEKRYLFFENGVLKGWRTSRH